MLYCMTIKGHAKHNGLSKEKWGSSLRVNGEIEGSEEKMMHDCIRQLQVRL